MGILILLWFQRQLMESTGGEANAEAADELGGEARTQDFSPYLYHRIFLIDQQQLSAEEVFCTGGMI